MQWFSAHGIRAALIASLALLGAASAHAAAHLDSWDQTAGTVIGTIHWTNPFSGGSDVDVTADIGGFNLYTTDTDTGATGTSQSYCVDIFQAIAPGTFTGDTVADYLSPYSAGMAMAKADQLNALISHAADGVSSNVDSAAVQLAVWEIIYDYTSTGSYSINSGAFTVSGSDADLSSAITLADTYLGNVTGGSSAIWQPDSSYSLSILRSADVQDQIIFTRAISVVPEPANWAMLVVGFAAMGGALRRRRDPRLMVVRFEL